MNKRNQILGKSTKILAGTYMSLDSHRQSLRASMYALAGLQADNDSLFVFVHEVTLRVSIFVCTALTPHQPGGSMALLRV